MEITVLLFASVAEKAGTRKLTMPSEPGDTVEVAIAGLGTLTNPVVGHVRTL